MDKLKDPIAVELGRRGGKKRAENMTPDQRIEAARKAVTKKWVNWRKNRNPGKTNEGR